MNAKGAIIDGEREIHLIYIIKGERRKEKGERRKKKGERRKGKGEIKKNKTRHLMRIRYL